MVEVVLCHSLVFIDIVTADKSIRMNSEVYSTILSAQIQPNASKLIGQSFSEGLAEHHQERNAASCDVYGF